MSLRVLASTANRPQPRRCVDVNGKPNFNDAKGEDEDARKSRINSELVQLLQTPSLPGRAASVQGFGVYTHVQIKRIDENGRPQDTSEIMFLPVGGPNKVRKARGESQVPVDDNVRQAWNKVEEAVDEEERLLHERDLDLQKLKERYGGPGVPEHTTLARPDAQFQQQQIQHWIEYLSRRASSAGMTSGDVTMGGMDRDTLDSNRALRSASLAAPSRGNVYHQERDPRKR